MAIDISEFRDDIVVPVLKGIGHYSESATALLLGTAAQESNYFYLRQSNQGPALGLYQMEPATHDSLWENFLRYRQELADGVATYLVPDQDRLSQLIWNLAYATAMCRVFYLDKPASLPAADDIEGLGRYWKTYYNTAEGAGSVEEFVANYKRYVLGLDV